jgi:hypothetical protein
MTETIKVEVDDELARRFRESAMEKYGYEKGAVKKAMEGLMEEFVTVPMVAEKPNWGALVGQLRMITRRG